MMHIPLERLQAGNTRILDVGPSVEAVQHHRTKMPEPVPGEHLWIMAGVWKVDAKAVARGDKMHLDTENLLSIDGPGCFWCECVYSAQTASAPCKGPA